MTAIRLPVIVVLPAFGLGLLLGYFFPSVPYLTLAFLAGVIAYVSFRYDWKRVVDVSLIVGFCLIGAQRMSASLQNLAYEVSSPSFIEQQARKATDHLTERLARSGLENQDLHLVAALLLGRRDGMTPELKAKFRSTGTSHVLALSGMHLSIIYGLLCILCVRWVRYSNWRWLALPLLVCGLWTYTLLTGAPASLVRSACMLSLVCAGVLVSNTIPLLHSLFLSAMLMLFFRPLFLFDIGFQLSCMAVLFIGLAYVSLQGYFHSWPVGLRGLARMLLLSLSAQLGTLPLCVYYFHSFPLTGALVSVILLPLTTLLMYAGLLALLIPIPLFASFVQACVRAEVGVMDYCLQIFPHSVVDDLHPSLLQVILIYVMMLAGCIRIYCLAEDYRTNPL